MDFMKKVTEISKKVGEGAEKTYKTVADKSDKLIKDAQMKIQMGDKESEVEGLYLSMGKDIYTSYGRGEEVPEDFKKSCKKVEKLLKEIDEIEIKSLYYKNLRKCANCCDIIELESKYCPKCGDKQKPVKIKEDKKEDKVEENPLDKVCPKCSRIALDDEAFCAECGYKFD